jgi:hypothetical protein
VTIASITGQGSVGDIDPGEDTVYGAQASLGAPSPFGASTTGRRMLYIWGAATLWLVIVWRAVEGY